MFYTGSWLQDVTGLGATSVQVMPNFIHACMVVDKSLIPSGKHTKNYGKSPFLIGQLTISMAMFNSYVGLPEDRYCSGFAGLSTQQVFR